MIKSMTGFGRSEIVKGNRKISVEIKSVNHRYLEAGIKMPKKLNVFESRMRDLLKKYATRGKIDIFINYEDDSESHDASPGVLYPLLQTPAAVRQRPSRRRRRQKGPALRGRISPPLG